MASKFGGVPAEEKKSKFGGVPVEDQPRPLIGDFSGIPESIGRFGRDVVEAAGDIADVFTNPIRGVLNQIPQIAPNPDGTFELIEGPQYNTPTSDFLRRYMDALNVPKPRDKAEQIVSGATQLGVSVLPFAGGAQALSKGLQGTGQKVAESIATAPGMQAASAAAAGGAGEAAKDYGPTAQLMASLAAGLTPVAAKSLYSSAAKTFTQMSPQVDEVLLQFDLRGVSPAVVQNLRQRVQNALNTGDIDGPALRRLIDYAKTGATPTRGKVTRNPTQWTQEENLARQAAAGNADNADMQRLVNIKSENTEKLISGLDDIARGTSLDLYSAGENAIGAISARNNVLKGIQRGLYERAQNIAGRDIPLNREEFIRRADIELRRRNANAFLPAEIKTMLNEIAYGQKGSKGETIPVPFNVNVIDQLETILATAVRSTKDGNAKKAIGAVRQALNETNVEGDLPAEAMKAFRNARAFSAKLYEWQKKSPAIHAIVEGDANPDQFVKEFVLANTKKATAENVSKMMRQLPDGGKSIIRNQVAAWIKNQATMRKDAEFNQLSEAGLRNALDSIGDRKLMIIFGPEDVKTLRTIQRVAGYEMTPPSGAAVNYSNTANTGIGQLMSWLEKISSKMPMANLVISPTAKSIGNFAEGRNAMLPEIGKQAKGQGIAPLVTPAAVGASAAANP